MIRHLLTMLLTSFISGNPPTWINFRRGLHEINVDFTSIAPFRFFTSSLLCKIVHYHSPTLINLSKICADCGSFSLVFTIAPMCSRKRCHDCVSVMNHQQDFMFSRCIRHSASSQQFLLYLHAMNECDASSITVACMKKRTFNVL
jgi:hypothetical protein